MTYLNDPIWYPPVNVIAHFKRIENSFSEEEKKSKVFRKMEEMFAVAIMLVGIKKIQKKDYWLQLVEDKEQSPDVRTITFVSPRKISPNDISIQDVEVVTYDYFSDDMFVDFMERTKLSNKKGYDALTTILCHIRRDILLPPLRELQQRLAIKKFSSSVMILGKTSPDKEVYKIAQINPLIDLNVEFNATEELRTSKPTRVLKLMRGSKSNFQHYPNEKHYPFEKLGLRSGPDQSP